jgi:uncharacterized protein YqgC (DUF456 family)
MDLTDTESTVTLVAGLAILIGTLGIVVPVLPGLALSWAGILFWAIFADGDWRKWLVFGIATAVGLIGIVVKYLWPGRNLKRAGVPNRSLVMGGLLGLVGFFVVPVVGLFLGFVLGVWLAERVRLGDNQQAWPSTVHALKAAGLAMLIELAAGLTMATSWLVGLVVT